MKMGQSSFILEGWRRLELRRLSLDTGGRVGFAGPQADSSNTKEGRDFFFLLQRQTPFTLYKSSLGEAFIL